ncbi:MAG: hypothetical protein A3G18_08010 [Rhodospirillales bacterium RIFCSPLOWO2_12_FULL_58_28]|nr:MAG: hypothetical protein A3H92_00400 [Rhodospirillales bacterium RIFCSPLOWO2_02_FULL_58_16]OHC78122.1 MAG: hypothetical protein A3G18_08010 [Rhodospirillales bacterium RIFCSPLOWO2_12_FULL_58_28]
MDARDKHGHDGEIRINLLQAIPLTVFARIARSKATKQDEAIQRTFPATGLLPVSRVADARGRGRNDGKARRSRFQSILIYFNIR